MTNPPPAPLAAPVDLVLEYREALLARLEQQPADFVTAIAAIPATSWYHQRAQDGRSIHLAAAHVRDLEALAYLPHVRRILREDRPVLTAEAHHTWSAASYDPSEPMTHILAAWSHARTELLAWLRPLPPAGWARIGFHPPSGNRTLQWWVERAYGHVRGHLAAIRQAR
jgi:hypothetical protein